MNPNASIETDPIIRSIEWGGFALLEFLISEQQNIPRKYSNCLDIGSGAGIHSLVLEDSGLEVIQLDKYSDVADYKEDYLKSNFNENFDVIFCSHVIEHQRNVGLFLDKIFDDLSDEGVLIISAPKHPAERLVEGHINCFIFPLFLQQLIYAGFDCSSAKIIFAGPIENSLIVHKAKDFDISEREGQAYEWSEKHKKRSPIELKSGVTIPSDDNWVLHKCEILKTADTGNGVNLSLNFPDTYTKIGVTIDMSRWGILFSI